MEGKHSDKIKSNELGLIKINTKRLYYIYSRPNISIRILIMKENLIVRYWYSLIHTAICVNICVPWNIYTKAKNMSPRIRTAALWKWWNRMTLKHCLARISLRLSVYIRWFDDKKISVCPRTMTFSIAVMCIFLLFFFFFFLIGIRSSYQLKIFYKFLSDNTMCQLKILLWNDSKSVSCAFRVEIEPQL